MVAAGALSGVAAILSLHVDPTRKAGTVGVQSGVFTASCDEIGVTVKGRGGHAARPHESNDPIAAAAELVSTIYQFVPRATDSQDAKVKASPPDLKEAFFIGTEIGADHPYAGKAIRGYGYNQWPDDLPEFRAAVLAYHAAILRDCDVDKPRNLAKSVTVE